MESNPLAECRTPREKVAALREFLKTQGFDVSRTELHALVSAYLSRKKSGLVASILSTVAADDLIDLEEWLSKNLPAPAPQKPYRAQGKSKDMLKLYPDEPE